MNFFYAAVDEEAAIKELREAAPAVVLWGQDLKSATAGSDIVLRKFLRARDFKVQESAEMLAKSMAWREENKVDTWKTAELPPCFEGYDSHLGTDLLGRPILLTKFEGMDPDQVFGDVDLFVQYRVKHMEELIDRLSFKEGEPETLNQIHDYTNVNLIFQPDLVKKGVVASKDVFLDNYPEFKGVSIFVNFPKVFAAAFRAVTVFFPKKTVDKFVILGVGESYRLYDYIAGEQIPVEYGGFARDRSAPSRPGGECVLLTVPLRGSINWEPPRSEAGEKRCRIELRAVWGDCDARVEAEDGTVLWENTIDEEGGIQEIDVEASGPVNVVFSNRAFFARRLVAVRAL
jgi:hypothetical protein